MCVCVCVHVRACVRVCVRACVPVHCSAARPDVHEMQNSAIAVRGRDKTEGISLVDADR